MYTITVYSKPNCQPCRATKKKLSSLNLDYRDIDVTDAPGAVEFIAKLGYTAAPVVVVSDTTTCEVVTAWQGYSPDKLKALAGAAKANEVAGV